MTAIRVDPALPGVDIDRNCCPGCGQTLAVILDGVPGLPLRHYRQPTRVRCGGHKTRIGVRKDIAGKPGNPSTAAECQYSDDDLARLVFIAQREAAA